MFTKKAILGMAAFGVMAALALPAMAENKATEARQTVEAARATLGHFLADPDMSWIREHLDQARAVLIVPSQGKGGFIFAGSGGVGVLLVRERDGQWSAPAFYRLASVSVGLQIGGEKSEVLLFVQSQKGVDSFLTQSFKLGADASVAAGPVGQGTQAATADVLSFSRSKGAFVGASLEGTMVKPAEDLNEAFYHKFASPVDILVRGTIKSELAKGLQEDLARATAPRKKK